MKIGIIGAFGGQGRRIIDVLKSKKRIMILVYDHGKHAGVMNVGECTSDLRDILSCDGIIIASPTNTHLKYLQYFIENEYTGYILCEKPPVANEDEAQYLLKISGKYKSKILFDFNLRYSLYDEIMSKGIGAISLGNLRYIDIVSGHGLGFKDVYEKSWRNDPQKMKRGVFETVGIHYIDLLSRHFGLPKEHMYKECIISPMGNVADNSFLCMEFDHDVYMSLYLSYTTPLVEKMTMVYENAIIEGDANELVVYGPRECFDANGYFVKPKELVRLGNKNTSIWDASIRNCILFFIDTISERSKIDEELFDHSIEINRMIWRLI